MFKIGNKYKCRGSGIYGECVYILKDGRALIRDTEATEKERRNAEEHGFSGEIENINISILRAFSDVDEII